MHKHHLPLQEILAAIHPNKIPAARKTALNEFRTEVAQFLQQRFPLHHERIGEPRTMGSKEKGTDVAFSYDIDLFVPFKFGFKNDPKGMKNAVYQALKEKFDSQPVTTVRLQRVSVGLIRTIGGEELAIDVVPGMEKSAGAYDDTSPDEAKKFLVLYDKDGNEMRTTNVHRHSRLIKENALHYRDIVRLLKSWRNKERSIKLGSFALELLVYRAAIAKDAPKTGALDELLHYVLQYNIPFLEAKGSLQDIGAGYAWPDYLSEGGKTQLAGLWKKLLTALETPDQEKLRTFFKVS
jgi:hypothetical protein